MKGWIPKREAIAMVIEAGVELERTLNVRASARCSLAKWVKRGVVRTRPGERPVWAKHPRRLYNRQDIARQIAARREGRWDPSHDSLLGTDFDRVIAERLGVALWVVECRRRKLGIAPHGPSTSRCNPGSWRRPIGG